MESETEKIYVLRGTRYFISIRMLATKFGVSKSTMHRIVTENEDFPPKIKISPRLVAWYEPDLDSWSEKRDQLSA